MSKKTDLIFEKIMNFIFPDISKKISWTIIIAGLGIVALPNPVWVIITNFLIDVFNENYSNGINFVQIKDAGPSSSVGITVLIIGAVYSIVNNCIPYLELNKNNSSNKGVNEEITNRKLESDTELYHKFIKALPPESESIILLKEHNFAGSFYETRIDDIDDFNDQWNTPVNHFSNQIVEKKLAELVAILKELNEKLSLRAHRVNGGKTLSIVPDAQRIADDFSEETWVKIREVNELARKALEAYHLLIACCKQELGV